jgi:DNA ligase-1
VSYTDQIFELEERYLASGFEGVMIRDPNSPYKQGRSTWREGWLLKVKRFEDSEALVIGMEEKMHNANESTTNALGHMERSSHIANMRPLNTMGALIVQDRKTGVVFNIGTGFDDAERLRWWNQPDTYVTSIKSDGGEVRTLVEPYRLAKYSYFPSGSKDKPRFPVYLGERNDL